MTTATADSGERLHALDALRGFALICGVLLHAAMSYLPGFTVWPLLDRSTSTTLAMAFFTIHMFRMTLFFVIAGFFARLLMERRGVRAFVRNRAMRIVVPLVVGWIVFFPLIVVAIVWGADGPLQPPGGGGAGAPAAPALAFPLAHLWFLYVLTLIYAAALPLRQLIVRLDAGGRLANAADAVMRVALAGPWAPLILSAPLIGAFLVSPWLLFAGIPTPDQSLIPNLPAAVAFSSAFTVGWLLHRQTALLKTIERWWALHLATAVAVTVACLAVLGPGNSAQLSTTAPSAALYTVLYAAGVWSWTLGLIGAALRFFAGESAVGRYVSDASYWIYLAHLPLVMALQALMKDWPLHWAVKFPLVVTVALAILFASYHLLVRYTFIGEVLNGVRHRRGRANREAPAGPPSLQGHGELLAVLANASKQFGAVKALDGLSLDVRPGELLAVLGPNGAGKSTAISLLLGLHQPDAGTASLFGRPPGDVEARYGVGVMMQEVMLAMEMSVREIITLTTSYYPTPMTADETMALTHTTALANRPYGKLSAGQKRQVQFALAVCGRPSLLFLDEPTVGLDVQAREMLWTTIRQLLAQGASIVLTTHYLEEAEALASRVAVLVKGRLVAMGTVDEIRGVVARKRVSCLSALPPEQVASWDGVDSASRAGNRLLVVTRDADHLVRRLLAADALLCDLEVERAGLAQAFTEITQEAA